MKKYLRVFLLIMILLAVSSYGSTQVWQKTFGGTKGDRALSIQQTKDGGYIVAGYTYSSGAGEDDVYVLKLDPNGKLKWEKTFGGKFSDEALSIQQTKDGGYIVAGYTYFSGDRGEDVYVLKLDSNGKLQWEKTFGGSDNDGAFSVQQTKDGGYIVAGGTRSSGAGRFDVYILKLDSNGKLQWEKTFGGSDDDMATSIQQTTDGGYIVAGYSYGAQKFDVHILKLDSNGKLQWEKTFGGSDSDVAFSIQQTKDGGYIVAGSTRSSGVGGKDVYVLKLDSNGNIQWEKTFGGSKDDEAFSIQQTKDGGYIVAGSTESFGAGWKDVYVLKLDSNGNLQWEKTFGNEDDDEAYSVQQTSDDGYIVAGSINGDIYVLKLDGSGNTGPNPGK